MPAAVARRRANRRGFSDKPGTSVDIGRIRYALIVVAAAFRSFGGTLGGEAGKRLFAGRPGRSAALHNGGVPTTGAACGGIILTGGASRRMGRDKASIRIGASGQTLARRTEDLLRQVAEPAVEVGSGHTTLRAVREDPPGGGPLAAVAAGWAALAAGQWRGPALVVATDLPKMNVALLDWLARHPAARSVVPVSRRRVQPLCARYRPEDLDLAALLCREGRTAMNDLIAAIDPVLLPEEEWAHAGGPEILEDVDTPEDLQRSAVPADEAAAPPDGIEERRVP